jgi:hypothetical protein
MERISLPNKTNFLRACEYARAGVNVDVVNDDDDDDDLDSIVKWIR